MPTCLHFDIVVIEYWNTHHKVHPKVFGLDGGKIRELFDSIPEEMQELRRAISGCMP
jgi:hypothetical protein